MISPVILGEVAAFDQARGLGTLRATPPHPDAGEEILFHCTAISDGSRNIEVGRKVAFIVVSRHGQWEADGVTPLAVS